MDRRIVVYEKILNYKYIEEKGNIAIYGIHAYYPDFKDSKNELYSNMFEDITSNEEYVNLIINKLEKGNILPIHLKDVIEDLIQ